MLNLEQYKNFKGTMSEFIGILEECMEKLNIQKDQQNLQRIIRYYINEKILAPSLREGRDYFYNYDHLLKFLYVRKHLSDGWPLNKIRDNAQFQDTNYFEEFFQNNETSNKQVLSMEEYFDNVSNKKPSSDSDMSMNLIKKLKDRSEKNSKLTNLSERLDKFNPFTSNQINEVPNLDDALSDINSDIGNVIKQEFISLQLSTSLVLLIEQSLMKKMNYDLSKKIGRAIGAALFHKNPLTTKQFQEILMKNQNSKLKDDLIRKLNKEIDAFNKREMMYNEQINALQIDSKKTELIQQEYEFLKKHLEEEIRQTKFELGEKEKEKSEIRFELGGIIKTLNDLKYESREANSNYNVNSINIINSLAILLKNPETENNELNNVKDNLEKLISEQFEITNEIESKIDTNIKRLEELLTEFNIK